jgi:hypothetical protein
MLSEAKHLWPMFGGPQQSNQSFFSRDCGIRMTASARFADERA